MSDRKVITAPFRMSFPSLLEPREDKDTGRKTYSLTMLFPPGSDLAPLNGALQAAMVDKFGADRSKWPNIKRKPADILVDFAQYNANTKKPLAGDWSGWVMVRASANVDYPPNVVGPVKGADGKFPIIVEPREVYSGRWAKASIDAYYYPRNGGGLTFGLKNVQLLRHDKSFSGGQVAPEADFEDASSEWSGEADAFEKGGNAGDGWN